MGYIFGGYDDGCDDPVWQDTFYLTFGNGSYSGSKEISRINKYFTLTLSKGNLLSDLEVDFDDVNHARVIETIQELIDVVEAANWIVKVS